MRKLVLAAAFALACAAASAATTAEAQGYSRAAQRVLREARAATGGAGWNLLRGWRETGHMGGLAYQAWLDPLRYGLRVEIEEPAGRRVHGYNGQGEWQVLPSGATLTVQDPAAVARTRAEAFFAVGGFLFPGRFDARGDYVGVRRLAGRAFDVVSVKPWGAAPRDLWFDRRSHLLARMVDHGGAKPRTIEVSDYRRVGPVLVAFSFTGEAPEPAAGLPQRRIESLVFTPADRGLFSLPRPPAPGAAAGSADAAGPDAGG